MKTINILFGALAGMALCSMPAEAKSVETDGTPMKVMSYNLRYTNKIDTAENTWAARRQPSIDMIRDERPDIIGFQEPRADQRANLVEDLGDTYGFFSAVENGADPKQCGHVAIMYLKDRFTLLDKGHFWLSPTPDVPSQPEWNATDRQYRVTVWVHLYDKVAGKDLYFYDTHLPYKWADNEARTECVRLNVARMKENAGDSAAVFITGDMNTSWHPSDKRREGLAPYFEWMSGARESAPVNLNPDTYSFNGFGGGVPKDSWNLDHIFYRNVTPLEFNVVSSEKYGVKYISDHYPITLTLTY